MAAVDVRYLTIAEIGRLLREGAVTSVEVTQACLDLIGALDARLHAFILVTTELALAQARAADEELAAGNDRGPLHGVPVALKDLYATKGIATTGHSRALIDWIPEEDSAATAALYSAGAVLVGKLSMHEFAFGLHDPDLPFPQARNPWNLEHVTGGSSTGSGAALAAGFCYGALGSDTGGSIRNPASWCGVVGIKPTFGRISRRGVVPLSWSLDHAGPMARSVEDCAFLLQALSGFDPADPASANVTAPDFTANLRGGVSGLRLGVPREWLSQGDGTDPEVVAAFDAAVETLRSLGATIVDVPSDAFRDARAANTLISTSESYTLHEKTLKKHPEKLSNAVRNRVREGAFISAADYMQAQRARVAIRAAISAVLGDVDAVISPASATPAEAWDNQDWGARFRRPAFAHPANLTGFPAIAVPGGMSEAGLPIGFQVMGRAFDEAMVLRVAHSYEQATDWKTLHPAF